MANSSTSSSNPIMDAVRDFQSTKQEHRTILMQIARDGGMEPETRRQLIEHLYDEEDEHLTRVSLLVEQGAPSRGTPSPRTSSPIYPALTVGSLRGSPRWTSNGRGTVGSLRRS